MERLDGIFAQLPVTQVVCTYNLDILKSGVATHDFCCVMNICQISVLPTEAG